MSKYKRADSEIYINPFATIKTRGRKEALAPDEFRTDFQRDVHRIIYSQSFRRLRHKTQVFYFPQNDHLSTRADHVLFVASAARTVARCLGLNEDLAEAIGLAHDIGHAPFGHQGEDILNGIIKNKPALKRVLPYFHHEVYGLRVVDRIAKHDRGKPGLNLTYEVRDGIASHCGEDFKTCKLAPTKNDKDLENIKSKKEAGFPVTLEGCIVRLVDKVAYFGKDIEDALEAKIISSKIIPSEIKKLGGTNGKVVGTILRDIIEQSKGKDHIAISSKYGKLMHQMIEFNIANIYKSKEAERYFKQTEKMVRILFDDLIENIDTIRNNGYSSKENIPFVYKVFKEYLLDMEQIYTRTDPDELKVLDFIAGMTDTFAVRSFQDLFEPKATV
jgi:dGTPase